MLAREVGEIPNCCHSTESAFFSARSGAGKRCLTVFSIDFHIGLNLPRFRPFLAVFLVALSFAAFASTARAVLMQEPDFVELRENVWALPLPTEGARSTLSSTLPEMSKAHTGEDRQLVSNDPCARNSGWLPQERNGVLFCGTLADFYAPKITPYPAAQSADVGGGSGFALLFLGIAALGLAVRRPVWITRLMR